MPFITGGFPGLTQEMLDMTYPDEYYKNVIEPAITGKGPVPSNINMIKNIKSHFLLSIDPNRF